MRIGRHPSSASVIRNAKDERSEASWPILIKVYMNHHWVGVLIVLGFGADCIKIVVSMATHICSSHRLTMGQN